MPAKHHGWQEARYHNSEATHRCAHSESHKPCALGSTTQFSPHREDSVMEHILNRRTATILTYINQGRRPAAFPVFPARPPRRRARAAPFSAARPGAAGRPAGASPAPMGILCLAPGPVVMAPPIPPRMRKDRAPDHRIRIPPVRRSGCGPADTNGYGEGKEGERGEETRGGTKE